MAPPESEEALAEKRTHRDDEECKLGRLSLAEGDDDKVVCLERERGERKEEEEEEKQRARQVSAIEQKIDTGHTGFFPEEIANRIKNYNYSDQYKLSQLC